MKIGAIGVTNSNNSVSFEKRNDRKNCHSSRSHSNPNCNKQGDEYVSVKKSEISKLRNLRNSVVLGMAMLSAGAGMQSCDQGLIVYPKPVDPTDTIPIDPIDTIPEDTIPIDTIPIDTIPEPVSSPVQKALISQYKILGLLANLKSYSPGLGEIISISKHSIYDNCDIKSVLNEELSSEDKMIYDNVIEDQTLGTTSYTRDTIIKLTDGSNGVIIKTYAPTIFTESPATATKWTHLRSEIRIPTSEGVEVYTLDNDGNRDYFGIYKPGASSSEYKLDSGNGSEMFSYSNVVIKTK